ncbi:hypothetical protein KUCAC02_009855, partial [Chaenocephalus aceratus]
GAGAEGPSAVSCNRTSLFAATETASTTQSMLLALVLEAMLRSATFSAEEKCYLGEVTSSSSRVKLVKAEAYQKVESMENTAFVHSLSVALTDVFLLRQQGQGTVNRLGPLARSPSGSAGTDSPRSECECRSVECRERQECWVPSSI